MNRNAHYALLGIAVVGISLRLLLFWINPPLNQFDNHYEPIRWIAEKGSIPPKDALWQSYQPPVFYVISAVICKLFLAVGGPPLLLGKVLQFIPCLYGILTIGMVYLILRKLPLSEFAFIVSFASICFLPRHIYMGALHSNDALAVLGVTTSTYLLLTMYQHQCRYPHLILTSIVLTATIFTKYTAFVVLPMAVIAVLPVLTKRVDMPAKKIVIVIMLLLGVPLVFLTFYCTDNYCTYGHPLPWNDTMLAAHKSQPRSAEGISYVSFKPWQTISTPILAPSNIGSFWTLIHSRMWFDLEPKFIYFTDKNSSWWDSYYLWLSGKRDFPTSPPLSRWTRATGATLITLGLIPLFIMLAGFYESIARKRGKWISTSTESHAASLFLILLLFNALGVVALTMKSPVYSSMKATYFMNSLPAFAVFFGYGLETFGTRKRWKWAIGVLLGLCWAVVTFHVIHIAWSLNFEVGM